MAFQALTLASLGMLAVACVLAFDIVCCITFLKILIVQLLLYVRAVLHLVLVHHRRLSMMYIFNCQSFHDIPHHGIWLKLLKKVKSSYFYHVCA
jgi:hypothetical protein